MSYGVMFPDITPSSRSYRAPERPRTVFQSQNGATTLIEFGSQQVDAQLDLQFRNITDDRAAEIITHYNDQHEDKWTVFDSTRGLGGMGTKLYNAVERGDTKLRWRYSGPPEITSVYPGTSTVTCKFVGYFYGA